MHLQEAILSNTGFVTPDVRCLEAGAGMVGVDGVVLDRSAGIERQQQSERDVELDQH
jgi:hypothetical protein